MLFLSSTLSCFFDLERCEYGEFLFLSSSLSSPHGVISFNSLSNIGSPASFKDLFGLGLEDLKMYNKMTYSEADVVVKV